MAKIKQEELIQAISEMSVLDLAELIKALEEKFGVSAQAMMAASTVGSTAPAQAAESEAQEEQTTFNVILASAGANKITVIKALRELLPSLGLKEAKDLVDGAPKEVIAGVGKQSASQAKEKLTAAGATVELK